MKLAYIKVHYHTLSPKGHYNTYEWEGEKNWPVYISGVIGEDLIQDLPWKLIKVSSEDDPQCCGGYYVRGDCILSRLYALTKKLEMIFKPIWGRIILTADVWGLARVPPGEVPSLKHFGFKSRMKYKKLN
jgi:hypothetical protein